MANVFKIYVYEVAIEVELTSLDISAYVENWSPVAPKITEDHLVESIGLVNVTLADWEKIEAILDIARTTSKSGFGNYVYFEYDLDVTRDAYRCRIYDGEMVTTETNLGSDIANAKYSGTLVVERDPYWEEKTATNLTVTNINGSATSAIIQNCNDGAGSAPAQRVNYVEINDIVSVGRMPLYAVLIASSTGYFGSATAAGKIILGIINSDLFVHNIEAASGTSTESDSASSGGEFERYALNASMTTLFTSTLSNESGSTYNIYKNGYYMVIARFANSPPANTYMQVTSGQAANAGPVIKLSTSLMQVLDVVKIPPDDGARSTLSTTLTLAAKGSGNLDLDFITLMPLESYAILDATGVAISQAAAGYVMVDTSYLAAYVRNFSGGRPISTQIPMSGPGLFLKPDNGILGDSRLVVVTATGTAGDGFDITARFTLYLYGRKRLYTI